MHDTTLLVPNRNEHKSRSHNGDGPRARVAVIGGGIAGLAAAWRLAGRFRVTLYERHRVPGLSAHGITIAAGDRELTVDAPLRVFAPGYYRRLLALYDELGIETETIDASVSHAQLQDGRVADSHFRYVETRVLGVDLPIAHPRDAMSRRGARLLIEHLRFVRRTRTDLARGRAAGKSFEAYLLGAGFSRAYVETFMIPTFAGVCTCSFEAAANFPAEVALELMVSGADTLGVRRVVAGVEQVSTRILERVQHFRGGVSVDRVVPGATSVRVREQDGSELEYDHVVLAVQANQALDLAQLRPREREALRAFVYERNRIVVHRDARLVPPRDQRATFNTVTDGRARAPMHSIWLNRLLPELAGEDDHFQTVNPLIEPAASDVIAEVRLQRAVVTHHNLEAARQLEAMHQEPDRRLWFCGAYAVPGVPLLETGVRSAERVADRLTSDSRSQVLA